MSEELLINITPNESRVALVDNGVLQEVHIERSRSSGLVGNIYKGRVSRVVPGMQAAFIDIGLDKSGFLHASDMPLAGDEDNEAKPPADSTILGRVFDGDTLPVQVLKDPIGSKGARLTTHLSISSRYLVYMPSSPHIGISQRIEDEQERQRLRELVAAAVQRHQIPGGYIARTVAENIEADELEVDMLYLRQVWADISGRIQSTPAPGVIYRDLPLFLRAVRDLAHPELERIRIDSRESFQQLSEFVASYVPRLEGKLELYQGERPLFDMYSVEDEIRKALGERIPLKSGGYLIIEQTEAMTTVDVNTGAYLGNRNVEETILKTNLEAATALARQLRLRNLGGIIIVDFIDMRDEEHKRQVLRAFERALERDRARTTLTGVSELGLVEMTRKRTRESLERTLCEPCRHCEGRGTMRTAETVCYEIFREILRESRQFECEAILVLASQLVVDRLLQEESDNVAELQEFIGRPVRFQVESLYTQEQYDIIPV